MSPKNRNGLIILGCSVITLTIALIYPLYLITSKNNKFEAFLLIYKKAIERRTKEINTEEGPDKMIAFAFDGESQDSSLEFYGGGCKKAIDKYIKSLDGDSGEKWKKLSSIVDQPGNERGDKTMKKYYNSAYNYVSSVCIKDFIWRHELGFNIFCKFGALLRPDLKISQFHKFICVFRDNINVIEKNRGGIMFLKPKEIEFFSSEISHDILIGDGISNEKKPQKVTFSVEPATNLAILLISYDN